MEIKTYPQYKDSGIEWIGKIPKDWKKIKGKHLFDIFGNSIDENEIFDEKKDGSKSIIYFKVDDMNKSKTTLYMSINKYKYTFNHSMPIPSDSILIPKRGAAIATNKVKISKYKCFIDTNIMALYTKYNNEYYSYFILSRGLWDIADVSTIPQINNKHINYLNFLFPSIEEQEQIAKYLDHKTSTIEKTITKNKKLIELLKEKRTSLINQTVTKGLNPDVPMKESGIEWIGKISSQFNISKLKYNCNISMGQSPDSKYYTNNNEYTIFVQGNADLENGEVIPRIYTKNITKISHKGDILLTVRAPCGDIAVNKYTICIGRGVASLSNIENSRYMYYYLLYLRNNKIWDTLSNGSTFEAISNDIIKNMIFIKPSSKEQKEIVDYLDKKTQKIDKTIEKIERNIELLEEYKESLIHNVVTGKIDVRDVEE